MKLRVGVPYPNHGSITDETKRSLKKLEECPHLTVEVIVTQGSNIPRARNGAVNKEISDQKFQKIDGFDFFLGVDADIEFTTDDVLKLLSRRKDVIGGLYPNKKNRSQAVAGKFTPHGSIDPSGYISMSDTGIKKTDWIGGGFTLIKKDVFERVEYPWYRYKIVSYTDDNEVQHQQQTSEDLGFCDLLREYGHDIWIDCDCKINHVSHPNEDGIESALNNLVSSRNQIIRYINQLHQKNAKLIAALQS